MEKVQLVLSVVSSIITTGIILYNTLFKGSRKREKEYYEKILKPCMVLLKKEKKVNLVKEVRKLVKRDDDTVPKYVFYLIDNNRGEELEKVLVEDYYDLYENDNKSIRNIINVVQKITLFLMVCITLFFVFFAVTCIFVGILSLIAEIFNRSYAENTIKWGSCIAYILLGIASYAISSGYMKLVKGTNLGRYTTNIKIMEKIIKQKVKSYDKYNSKSYF